MKAVIYNIGKRASTSKYIKIMPILRSVKILIIHHENDFNYTMFKIRNNCLYN